MVNEHIYCNVCNKVIPQGTTHLTVSAMREHFVPDDQRIAVDGEANLVFICHEECIPNSVEIDLSEFANPS